MKAEELRIGNVLKQGVVVRIQENAGRMLYTLDGQPKQSYVNYEFLEGIPLTEERLIKFGFKSQKQFFLFHKSNRQIDFNVFSWETPVGQSNGVPANAFYILINGVIVVLEHVHQLQNLYFALTGEELIINS